MATISYTPYHSSDKGAILRTCKYVLDHGEDPYSIITRYATAGHSGILTAKGNHVAPTAELAAQQMEHYKAKYKERHPVTRGTNDSRYDVDLLQIYVSFEHEESKYLSYEKIMQIAEEFIERTGLNEFPILITPHFDKSHKHFHLVTCCYSINAERKISMNKEQLYELRRQMDYICVKHGLSIVEPELPMLRDTEYKAFYENVKAENLVSIIPRAQKGKPMSRRKKSMQAQMNRKVTERTLKDEFKRENERKRRKSNNYYIHPGVYQPNSKKPIYVYKYDETGRSRTLIELMLILLFMTAGVYKEASQQRKPRNIYEEQSQHIYCAKVDVAAQRTMDAIMLSRKYDVRTVNEVQAVKDSVGNQMNHCKTMIKVHTNQLAENQRKLAEMEQDTNDIEYQKLIATGKIIERRIEYQNQRLKELNKEYRDMCWMDVTLERTQFENELRSIQAIEKYRASQTAKNVQKETPVTEKHRRIELER